MYFHTMLELDAQSRFQEDMLVRTYVLVLSSQDLECEVLHIDSV